MIHYGNEGEFEEAYFDDAHLMETTAYGDDLWDATTATLKSFTDAEGPAKFSFRLESDSGPSQTLFADEEMLRDIREAITSALGASNLTGVNRASWPDNIIVSDATAQELADAADDDD